MHPALVVQFGSVALTMQCDLILSKVATITRRYNFTIGSSDSMQYIFVADLILSNSGKPTVVSIGTKSQDLGDRVAASCQQLIWMIIEMQILPYMHLISFVVTKTFYLYLI